MKTILTSLALFILLGAVGNAQSRNSQNGSWWGTLTPDGKAAYVKGFIDGLRDVESMLDAYRVKKEVVIERDAISGINRTRETSDTPKHQVVDELERYCRQSYEFTTDEYVAEIDKFYSEKTNTIVPIHETFEVARMYLRKKNPKEINAHLRMLREEYK